MGDPRGVLVPGDDYCGIILGPPPAWLPAGVRFRPCNDAQIVTSAEPVRLVNRREGAYRPAELGGNRKTVRCTDGNRWWLTFAMIVEIPAAELTRKPRKRKAKR